MSYWLIIIGYVVGFPLGYWIGSSYWKKRHRQLELALHASTLAMLLHDESTRIADEATEGEPSW